MRLVILEVRPVARSGWVQVKLRMGASEQTFAARVIRSRMRHGVLEGVVFGRKLHRALAPNLLLARPLIEAILAARHGRPVHLPRALGDFPQPMRLVALHASRPRQLAHTRWVRTPAVSA